MRVDVLPTKALADPIESDRLNAKEGWVVEINAIAPESYGVLVGWSHEEFNGRLDLRMQCARSQSDNRPKDIASHHFMMTRNQAVVLANYLLSVTGQNVPPRKRKGLLARLIPG